MQNARETEQSVQHRSRSHEDFWEEKRREILDERENLEVVTRTTEWLEFLAIRQDQRSHPDPSPETRENPTIDIMKKHLVDEDFQRWRTLRFREIPHRELHLRALTGVFDAEFDLRRFQLTNRLLADPNVREEQYAAELSKIRSEVYGILEPTR